MNANAKVTTQSDAQEETNPYRKRTLEKFKKYAKQRILQSDSDSSVNLSNISIKGNSFRIRTKKDINTTPRRELSTRRRKEDLVYTLNNIVEKLNISLRDIDKDVALLNQNSEQSCSESSFSDEEIVNEKTVKQDKIIQPEDVNSSGISIDLNEPLHTQEETSHQEPVLDVPKKPSYCKKCTHWQCVVNKEKEIFKKAFKCSTWQEAGRILYDEYPMDYFTYRLAWRETFQDESVAYRKTPAGIAYHKLKEEEKKRKGTIASIFGVKT